jgi:hypothetical protein
VGYRFGGSAFTTSRETIYRYNNLFHRLRKNCTEDQQSFWGQGIGLPFLMVF